MLCVRQCRRTSPAMRALLRNFVQRVFRKVDVAETRKSHMGVLQKAAHGDVHVAGRDPIRDPVQFRVVASSLCPYPRGCARSRHSAVSIMWHGHCEKRWLLGYGLRRVRTLLYVDRASNQRAKTTLTVGSKERDQFDVRRTIGRVPFLGLYWVFLSDQRCPTHFVVASVARLSTFYL